MSTADLAEPLRTAIVNNAGIVALLATYASEPAVFTRRPVPIGGPYPLIIISPDVAVTNEDGINDYRPIVSRSITVWAANDTPAHYRLADQIGYLVRTLFHRNRSAITVSGWAVVDIQVNGPEATPSDDDQTAGVALALQIRLAKLR